jgi:hypothetical protein
MVGIPLLWLAVAQVVSATTVTIFQFDNSTSCQGIAHTKAEHLSAACINELADEAVSKRWTCTQDDTEVLYEY